MNIKLKYWLVPQILAWITGPLTHGCGSAGKRNEGLDDPCYSNPKRPHYSEVRNNNNAPTPRTCRLSLYHVVTFIHKHENNNDKGCLIILRQTERNLTV